MKKKDSIMRKIISLGLVLLMILLTGMSGVKVRGEEVVEANTPSYDIEELYGILDSIEGMGVVNDGISVASTDDNMLARSAGDVGKNIYISVLNKNVGSIDMIRYGDNGSWTNEGSWSEGVFGLSNGEVTYCADPNVAFVSGYKLCRNATDFYTEDTVKTVGMMMYYYDTWVKCGGTSSVDDYLIKQCIVWSVLSKVNGWLDGITLAYGNGVLDGEGHYLSGHLATALINGAEWAADSQARASFTCRGYIYQGNGQDQSQWEYSYNPEGYLQLKKASSNTSITNDNPCYSLAGAVYEVKDDSGNVIEQLTTDESGNSNMVTLDAGTYYVKEIAASKGYALDATEYAVNVVSGETATVTGKEPPFNDSLGLALTKVDQDSNGTANVKSLEGAQFEVKYYAVDPDNYNGLSDLEQIDATRTWMIATKYDGTDGRYKANLGDPWKVSGDDFYYQDGIVCLPLGVMTVEEKSAPEGYKVDGATLTSATLTGPVEGKYFTKITGNGTTASLGGGNVYTVSDKCIRGGVKLAKWDNESKTQKAQGAATLEGAQFAITNENSYDVVVNGNVYKSGQVVATLITNEKGIAKSTAELLPYGKYGYKETKAPNGYLATGSNLVGTFEIKKDGVIVDLSKKDMAIKNNVIRGDITFTKADAETSERMANIPFKITSNTTGESHIVYTDENGYYSSESKYVKHSENTNAEKVKCGTWFGLDATGNQVDVKDSVGAFPYDTYTIEEISCNANKDKALFKGTFTISMDGFTIDHGTITNGDIALQTTAKDAEGNSHTAFARENVTIVDTVFYTGLKKNKTYTVKGVLMDKETGEKLLDVNGNEITAETSFETVTKNGLIDVTFTFDGTGLDGKDIVVFEECYDEDGEVVTDHKDIEDQGQTIHFEENPEIKTSAKDAETNDHISRAKENVTIVDTVTYKNLTVGKKYAVTGTLMDQKTGKAIKDTDGHEITAETVFVAETKDGKLEVIFEFDGSHLAGETVVVFEELYYNGKIIATHSDLEDEEQIIYFPQIKTTATDKEDGDHTIKCGQVTIVDTVKYENLIPGLEYKVSGVLMDKTTGEIVFVDNKEVTGEAIFTPEKATGTVEVTFTFDASSLEKKEFVVFEKIYNAKGKEIANHEDLEDKEQTVIVGEKEKIITKTPGSTSETKKTASTVKTGDETQVLLYMAMAVVALVIGGIVIGRKKRMK